MTILLISTAALIIFLISVDASWSNVLSTQRNNLVFEGRNMQYGAYSLRREQPRNMFIALTIVLGLTGAGSAAAMMMTGDHDTVAPPNAEGSIVILVPPTDLPDTSKKDDKTDKPQDSKPKAAPSGVDNTEPVVTTDQNVKPMPSQDDLRDKRPGPPGDDEGDGIIEPIETKGTGGQGDGEDKKKKDEPVIPDHMPEFPGGDAALLAYMAERVEYGEIDIQRGVNGTIHMSFTVLADGSVTDIKTERGIQYGENLEKKAISAIQKMPLWKPGIKAGKPVPVRFRIPLKFMLRS
ncbi:MAG: energy transducer TonB [Flavobacteriales bacterium]